MVDIVENILNYLVFNLIIEDGQWLNNLLTILAFLLAIPSLYITIKLYRKYRRDKSTEKLKDIFNIVCLSPRSFINSNLDVYNKLICFYKDEYKNINKDYIAFDINYFKDCLVSHYKYKAENGKDILLEAAHININDDYFNFPLITKPNYLLSKNSKFEVKNTCEVKFNKLEQEHLFKKSTTDFLNYFDIDSLSSFLKSSNTSLWDGITFDLDTINDSGDELKLGFRLGTYFNFTNYYEIISRELLINVFKDRKFNFIRENKLESYFPKDEWILRRPIKTLEDLFSFKNRPAKIGLNVFVIMKGENNKFHTLIHKRSDKKAEYPGYYHVMPAGSFQPPCDFDIPSMSNQTYFSLTILTELFQEYFGLESNPVDPLMIFQCNILGNNEYKDIDEIYGDDIPADKIYPAKYLFNKSDFNTSYKCDKTDYYEIIPTGFIIDLMTLKPELTFVLNIKNSKFYTSIKKASLFGNWEGNVKGYDIESPDFQEFLKYSFSINSMLPAGAVAITEGINYFFKNQSKFKSHKEAN